MTRALRTAGAPARALLLAIIKVYRVALSSSLGGQCRFYPSCSHYAEDAIRTHGAAKGTALTVWRIARCGPFSKGGVDHVPPRRHGSYDGVIPVRSTAS